ncbi:MAG: hypothetical protein II821_08650 [Treponema sp.]|nr:hypothetical protein [Treponema sp.]
MKKLIITFFALIGISILLSCETQASKTKALLAQAKEEELPGLYNEIYDYIQNDENYVFDKKKNKFTVQPEAVEHILLSLLKFHNENHTPLLTDKEHPENWDNWFYYYKQILNPLELSEGKFYKYNNELSTRCEYCRLAYKDNSDITWPNITYGLINEFSVATEIVNKLEELEVAKQKADAEEAERKRIEATRFKGVLGCEFGMSISEVKKKLTSKGIKNSNGEKSFMSVLPYEPNFAEDIVATNCTYGGIKFSYAYFLFINNSLYKIILLYDGSMAAYLDSYFGENTTSKTVANFRSLINDITLKYEFNNKPTDGNININGIILYGNTYKKNDGTEMFAAIENGHSFVLNFTSNKIKNENYDKALQKTKESVSKRTDF